MRILFFLIVVGFIACSEEEGVSQVEEDLVRNYELETFEYREKVGVNKNLLSLDIYHAGPREKLRPVLFYVHGGGWVSGDKTTNLENKMNLVRELDYILVSVNYRLSPSPYELDNPKRIQFPTHNRDVADAYKWVYDNIQDFGGDNRRMGIMGHSAGAQLVALMGTNELFLEKVGLSLSDVKFVIPIDTRGYDVAKQIAEGTSQDLYENAFSNDPLLHELASPLYNISSGKDIPPFFVAKRGGIQRIIDANEFINKLKSADIEVGSVDGSEYTHGGINRAIGEDGEGIVTPPIKQFIIDIMN